ncbi:hypothetical protein QZH41_019221, partial [Actinostola sp. cb2023]
MAALTSTQLLLALGMLISGSINTLSKKAQNDCSSKGLKDEHGNEVHKFDHPWFQTGLMFIGETLCLISLYFHRRKERKKFKQNLMNVNQDDSGEVSAELSQQPRVFQWIFVFPTVCDLFGTTLGENIPQEKVMANSLDWHDCYHGIALILAGQSVSATQMIVEELFLKRRNYHPLQVSSCINDEVVGMEGIFGVVFMSCLVLPVLYYIPGDQNHHSYENSLDALLMMKNDTKLLIMSVLYICSISFYNFFGLSVTKSLTAVHRTLIDACRTIVVWLVDLFVYYVFHE